MKEVKGRKRLIVLVTLFIILVVGFLLCLKIMKPSIKLNGEKMIKLTINSEYDDAGANAKFLGKNSSNNIKITGKVNTGKVGKYVLNYSIKKGILKSSVKRTVEVVEEGPVINLDGETEDSIYTICPNATYEEVGFSAEDFDENDLTDKVKSTVSKNEVKYSVKDKNGVMYYKTRRIERADKDAPEIKLNGNSHVYVTLGNTYKDSGAIAIDKCDGDLTDKIVVTGEVDTNTLGDYEINYKVSDKLKNEASETRTVTVQKEIVKRTASLGCGEPGVIYLTFDDGPGGDSTIQILNILKKYDVKATFFVTNNGSSSLIKREYDEGHLVALHTASHNYSKIYASDEAYWNDLNAVNATVEKVTGKKSNIVRFPGGSSNTVSRRYSSGIMTRLANDLESKGYAYFDWNIDSRDAEGKNSDQIYSNVVNGLSKSYGNVILMHDIKYTTANAIERIIKYGLDNGYTFKVLNSNIVCHHRTAN